MGNDIEVKPLPTEEEIIGRWMEFIEPLTSRPLQCFALVGFLLNRENESFDVDSIGSIDKTAIVSSENCNAVTKWATENFRNVLCKYCEITQTFAGRFAVESANEIVHHIIIALGVSINMACALFGALLSIAVNEWCTRYGIERKNGKEGFYYIKKNDLLSLLWSKPSKYHGRFNLVITPKINESVKESLFGPAVRIIVPGGTTGKFYPTTYPQDVVDKIYESDRAGDSHSYQLNRESEQKIRELQNRVSSAVEFIA
jgi:hypothetical protein